MLALPWWRKTLAWLAYHEGRFVDAARELDVARAAFKDAGRTGDHTPELLARFRPRPDRRDDFVALLEEVQAASRRDDGCLHYGYYTEITEPLSFIAVEEWADRDALDRHFAEPHLQAFAGRLRELVSEAPEVAIHEIAGTEGFPGRNADG